MQRLLIVGAVRDAAKTIQQIHMVFEKSFEDFDKDYFLVESDSSDSSLKILLEMSRTYNNFAFVSLGNLSDSVANRSSRIATCRNEYLREFESRDRKYDYLVIADWDNVNRHLTKNAVNSCWRSNDWEVCTANQKGAYYDLWALRCEDWLDYDCQLDFLRNSNIDGVRRSYFKNFIRPMFHTQRFNQWTRTRSSFGGLAIYKAQVIGKYRYSTRSEFVCEHVEFHEAMSRDGVRIFINPELINSNWTSNVYRSCLEFLFYIVFGKVYNHVRNRRYYSHFLLKT